MTERRAPLKARLAIGAALTIVVSSTIGGVSAKGGKWSVKAPIPNPRPGLAVGVVNGILYAVGGDRGRGDVADRYLTLVEAYNPVTNSWTTKAPMPTGRWGVAVGVLKGTLYAVGGVGRPLPGSMKSVVLSTVEAYDPITNSWATKAPMPTPRSALAVGVVNGILYALGGSRSPYGMIGVDFLNTVEAYDPSKNAWTTTASIPVMRDSFAAGVITKTLYLLGTAGVCSERASVMEAYDPTRNGWKPKAAIPNHSVVSSVGVINQTLFAVTTPNQCDSAADAATTVQAYDVVTDTWTMRASMPAPRYGAVAGVANGVLYVLGGYSPIRVEIPNPSAHQLPAGVMLTPDLLGFEP